MVPIAKTYFSVGFRGEIRKVCFEIGTKSEIRPVRYLLEMGSKVVKIDKNLKIVKIEKKCSFFTYRSLSWPKNSRLQLKLKKTGFSIFSKITKKSECFVILLIFVNARSQSSVGVESSRGTQNAHNKPN